jgi:hypothetical protein
MKKINKKIVGLLFGGAIFVLPQLVLAESIEIKNPLTVDSFETAFTKILTTLETFVAGIAIATLIIAGLVYIFSQGNEQRTTTAKKIMLGSMVGLAVVLGGRTFLKELYVIFGKDAPAEVSAAKEASAIINNALNLILSILGMIGIISFVWGAFIYLTSAGDEQQAENGKKQIVYSVIGLAIAIGSLIIVKQVEKLLTISMIHFT